MTIHVFDAVVAIVKKFGPTRTTTSSLLKNANQTVMPTDEKNFHTRRLAKKPVDKKGRQALH